MNGPPHHPFRCPVAHQTWLLLTRRLNVHHFINLRRLNFNGIKGHFTDWGWFWLLSFVKSSVLFCTLILLPLIFRTRKCTKIQNKQLIGVIKLMKQQLQSSRVTRSTLWKMGHNGTHHGLLPVNPVRVYIARQGGARGTEHANSWMNKPGENICIMTYLSHILFQLWIPINVVTPTN